MKPATDATTPAHSDHFEPDDRARRRAEWRLTWMIAGGVAVVSFVFGWFVDNDGWEGGVPVMPMRQAYLNNLVTSEQRATLLSFDSMLGSSGGAAIQPVLGRAADAWSYPASYAYGAAIQALALPFLWLARPEQAASDPIAGDSAQPVR